MAGAFQSRKWWPLEEGSSWRGELEMDFVHYYFMLTGSTCPPLRFGGRLVAQLGNWAQSALVVEDADVVAQSWFSTRSASRPEKCRLKMKRLVLSQHKVFYLQGPNSCHSLALVLQISC